MLASGLRTADIWSEGCTKVGTRQMGDAVVAALAGKNGDHQELARSGSSRPSPADGRRSEGFTTTSRGAKR